MNNETSSAYESLKKCNEVLRTDRHPELLCVEFGEPLPRGVIDQWQRQNAIRLPPSFARFLEACGSMAFMNRWGNRHYATTPLEKLLARSERLIEGADRDPAEEPLRGRLLMFQDNPYPSNAFAFDLKSADETGETRICTFYHDDKFDFAFGGRGRSFDEHIDQLLEEQILVDIDEPEEDAPAAG
jgi:hypothetical protein